MDHRGGSDFLFFYRVKKKKAKVDSGGSKRRPGLQKGRIPPVEFFRRMDGKLKEGEQKERHLHKEAVDNREGEGLEK